MPPIPARLQSQNDIDTNFGVIEECEKGGGRRRRKELDKEEEGEEQEREGEGDGKRWKKKIPT